MLLSLLIVSLIANLWLWHALDEADRVRAESQRHARIARGAAAQASAELHAALERQNILTRRVLEAERREHQAHKLMLACRHLPNLSGHKLRPFHLMYEN